MDLLIVLVKTLFFYWIIVLVYRFMGKREVGELSIVDLIVSILIAELAAMSIEQYNKSIFLSLIPMIVLVLLQIVLAKLSLKHPKVNYKELVKQRYNLEDLLTQLRAREIKSLEEVDYAILETSGKLSVFQKQRGRSVYPLAVILDGVIQEDTLKAIKRDKKWLEDMLKFKNVNLEDVFYGFYKNHQLFLIKNSDCIT